MDKSILYTKPREEWERLIYQWVFDELGRQILIRYLLDGVCYEKIAEEFDVSRATVYNKVSKYSKQLFKNCD